MKYYLIALMLMASTSTAKAADVGVSVSIGQPGFYGRIDIGDFPRPQIIHPRPIVVRPPRGRAVAEPIYLRVPPGHAKNWRKYCDRYDACGRPVLFVQDRWYNDVYAPRYRERQDRDDDRGRGGDKGRNQGRGHGRN
ncbi:MAG: hypothetical protein M0009_11635 [Deltaproteobacteria bacterium]|nr:hypothetical protein [Deltaproteobacteria bacterium]